ncbi:hypothetical protein HG530_005726 [Fusarium avenaceum]|nr:hypothetical protein HG530_005726 [Fusarium avenaceum]
METKIRLIDPWREKRISTLRRRAFAFRLRSDIDGPGPGRPGDGHRNTVGPRVRVKSNLDCVLESVDLAAGAATLFLGSFVDLAGDHPSNGNPSSVGYERLVEEGHGLSSREVLRSLEVCVISFGQDHAGPCFEAVHSSPARVGDVAFFKFKIAVMNSGVAV